MGPADFTSQRRGLLLIFVTKVDVSLARPDRQPHQRHRLHQQVRETTQHLPILDRPRFAFIGIADDIFVIGSRIAHLREFPQEGFAGTPHAAKIRLLDAVAQSRKFIAGQQSAQFAVVF